MKNTGKIFESHAHYDLEQFDEDRDDVLYSMADAGVDTIINVGATLDMCQESINLTEYYDFIYAAIGIHPDDVGALNDKTWERLKGYVDAPKVVAVGEIGLDYYWDKVDRDLQKHWFIKQLELAREKNLPVVIHSREATKDTLDIMKEHASDLKGVIHCFSGSVEVAHEYIKMGYYIGVGGVVTFKNGRLMREVVENIPLESILLETDCPYLSPEPRRGKRNDSRNIKYIAKEVAKIKGVSYAQVLEVTHKNGRELYGI